MYASGTWFIFMWESCFEAFFFTQFFSNIVESVLFYSGMVTREVKSGKREFSRWRNRKKLDNISYRFVHVTGKGRKMRGN